MDIEVKPEIRLCKVGDSMDISTHGSSIRFRYQKVR